MQARVTAIKAPEHSPTASYPVPRSGYAGIGNQAALRRLAATPPQVQTKLEIGAAGDPLEHEADRVADAVMRMPEPPVLLSRKCAECEEEEKKGTVQTKPAGIPIAPATARPSAPSVVHEVIATPGRPLDAASRGFFEPRFGQDFSQVRIHEGSAAADSARAIHALAYTFGQHIVLGAGGADRRLLAHELAHVLQQERGGRPAVARQAAPEPPVVGIQAPAPPYLGSLEARLQKLVDKRVKFVAEWIAPLAEVRQKYPPLPLREDAILDIPSPFGMHGETRSFDLNAPSGRFQLHSHLYGGYELLDYPVPDVIIARDGVGYVLFDTTFAWLFGAEFPEMYAEFEEPLKYRHENPFKVLFANVATSALFPFTSPEGLEAFLFSFIFPFLGMGELGAASGTGGAGFEPGVDLPPVETEAPGAGAPATDVAPAAPSLLKDQPAPGAPAGDFEAPKPSTPQLEQKPPGPAEKSQAPRTAPVPARARLDLGELMTGSPYKPTQRVIYRGSVEKMAKAMKDGTFDWAGMDDPIIVDRNGNIQQGHHRIVAARLAGKPVPKSAIKTVDVGVSGRDPRPWSSVTVLDGERPH